MVTLNEQKDGYLFLSVFIVMVILTGAPLLLPEKIKNDVDRVWYVFPIDVHGGDPGYYPSLFLFLREKEGFGWELSS